MNRLNRRAGPHVASFAYPLHPTETDELVFVDRDGVAVRERLNHGLGESVLETLGFVRGPEFWFRRVTERAG
jgi:hypothetical protein